jgi:hypothetical protein
MSKIDSLLGDVKGIGKQDEGVGGTPKKNRSNSPYDVGGDREYKKWVIPDAKIVERGKIFPNSIFFTDKPVLESSKKSRVSGMIQSNLEIKVWTNSEDEVCLLRA